MNNRANSILDLIRKRKRDPFVEEAIEDFLEGKSEEFKDAYKQGRDDGWFDGFDVGLERGRSAVHHLLNLYDDKRTP